MTKANPGSRVPTSQGSIRQEKSPNKTTPKSRSTSVMMRTVGMTPRAGGGHVPRVKAPKNEGATPRSDEQGCLRTQV
eukprot:CAMPEP_0206234482 /NCGR_PEP_ID=MMETSP0047_2-20121206/12617_1 /ASSEMBLY_ACC=CAM_ASM_000192 /TAXON_ID=195065 /ORGANISM="Chroomonas mesostigmatica_cf, Strain CCMP1168" /LENGTH=76 /DNA_ID=CAMNT_0053658577 /DNA_START=239 /DNA_END=469 /DNA_ORIENTATION=-